MIIFSIVFGEKFDPAIFRQSYWETSRIKYSPLNLPTVWYVTAKSDTFRPKSQLKSLDLQKAVLSTYEVIGFIKSSLRCDQFWAT